jgi:hypothetical protein
VFATKNITNIRMNPFKSLRCSFAMNVNRDGSLTVMFQDKKDACKILNQHRIDISYFWMVESTTNTEKIVGPFFSTKILHLRSFCKDYCFLTHLCFKILQLTGVSKKCKECHFSAI